jgi:hypothetical protein
MIGCKSDRLTVVSENATNAKALDLDGMEGVECRIFYYKASGKVYCSPIFVFRESQHRIFIGQVTYGRKFVKGANLFSVPYQWVLATLWPW